MHEAGADTRGEGAAGEGDDRQAHPQGVGRRRVRAIGEGVEEQVGEPIVPGKPNQFTMTGAGRRANTLVRALLVKPLRSTRMSISSARICSAACSSVMSLMSIQ